MFYSTEFIVMQQGLRRGTRGLLRLGGVTALLRDGADLIPPLHRLADLTPGTTVGVPGGILTGPHAPDLRCQSPLQRRQHRGRRECAASHRQGNQRREGRRGKSSPEPIVLTRWIGISGSKRVGSRFVRGTDRDDHQAERPAQVRGSPFPGGSGDWWYPNRLKFDIAGNYKAQERPN